jgi:hypothetical protein
MALADTTGEVVLRDPATELERAADPGEFVVLCLERGKSWLAEALDKGDLDALVNVKGYAEVLRVATVQKQLGKDAELTAAELVRRAERAIGLGLRRGQEDGAVARRGERGDLHDGKILVSSFFTGGQDTQDTFAVTDGVSDEVFEAALSEAKEEGNVSRANVVRKVKTRTTTTESQEVTSASAPPRNMPAEQRAEQIRPLAAAGMVASQISAEIGVSEERVRELARRFDIPLFDLSVRGMKRIDPNRVVQATVDDAALVVMDSTFDMLAGRYGDLDRERLEGWVSSLSDSIRSLTTLRNHLKKELTRG